MKATVWLLLCLSTVAVAEPQRVAFHTLPSDVTVVDLDNGQAVAAGDVDFTADSAVPHHYRLHRPPFDDRDLTLRWDSNLGRWWLDGNGPRMPLSPDETIALSRTVKLQICPPDTSVYVAAEPNEAAAAMRIDGTSVRVRPLVGKAGNYVVPSAWQPPPLYLVHSGFVSRTLAWRPGELDSTAAVVADLKPAWGPFSYARFDIALGLAGLAALAAWGVVLRPAARHRQARQVRDRAVARQVDEQPLAGLAGTELRADERGSYVLLRLLGQGGMGAVYEAVSTALEQAIEEHVAIKLLHSPWQNESARQRFLREIRVCCTLRHPNIVQVLDWGRYEIRGGACPFLVMELVAGQTLSDALKKGVQSEAEVSAWLGDLLRALRVAHQAGIAHRDVKPDNVMVLPGGRVKLMDFGVARVMGEQLTKAGSAVGTPQYMSPEHFAGEVTPLSDLYSLGVMAYQCLSGRLPHQDETTWGLMLKVTHEDPPHLLAVRPGVDERLGYIVMKLLARQPAERFASADAALQALEPLLAIPQEG